MTEVTFTDDVWPAAKPRTLDRHKRSNAQRRGKTANAPFVGWDGEGITHAGRTAQSYVLFGNSEGGVVESYDLSTTECFRFMVSEGERLPDAIHVVFSMGYDVNMILRDLTVSHLRRLWQRGKSYWIGDDGHLYNLEYRPRKTFTVKQIRKCRVCGYGKDYRSTCSQKPCASCPSRRSIRLWDVWGFYQSSFVKALTSWNVGSPAQLQTITDGKTGRSTFDFSSLAEIRTYWQLELQLLVDLMGSFREQITSVGFTLNRWDGPGAVASHLYKSHGSREHMGAVTPEFQRLSQHAYSGGRIEQHKFGNYDGTVYVYDINSAYPAGIATLPSLTNAVWRDRKGDVRWVPMSLYHLRVKDSLPLDVPAPVAYRAPNGSVNYTRDFDGWYWTPEAQTAVELFPNDVEVLEWHEFRPGSDDKPFGWVQEMYDQRRKWKAEGNAGERVLKLGLNSLYGKMAQHNGWKPGDSIPPYHQLQWAGYVTSSCRAQLMRAMMMAPSAIIGVETDSILTTEPLTLDVGSGLGQWSEEKYDGITYVQAGVYWLRSGDSWLNKCRGFDSGSLSRQAVLDRWRLFPGKPTVNGGWVLDNGEPIESHSEAWKLPVTQTRFIGMGVPLATGRWDLWRSWHTGDRSQSLAPITGASGHKRRILSFSAIAAAVDGLQSTRLGRSADGALSEAHTLPWIDGMPAWWAADEHFVGITGMLSDPKLLRAMGECAE